MHVPVGVGLVTIRGLSMSNTFGPPGIRTNTDGSPRPHHGWDIACFEGSKVYAISAGKVVATRNEKEGGDYGNQIILEFNDKSRTLYAFYAHLLAIKVQVGEDVEEGQVLGLSGKTGNAKEFPHYEEHLHFEIRTRKYGGMIDPGEVLGYGPISDILKVELRELFQTLAPIRPLNLPK